MQYTNSINELTKQAIHCLNNAGIETACLDVQLLLAHTLNISREKLLLFPERILTRDEQKTFNQLIERRKKNEPVAYIVGKKEFWSLDFIVTRDTLIPRPDSETLVEAAVERAKRIAQVCCIPLTLYDFRILDIGTGTACLLISLLKELPSARGMGVDISEEALKVARNNASNHRVSERVHFIKSDWCGEVNEKFDLIISNPPYIAYDDLSNLMKDVILYEPHSALESGHDGMDGYRILSKQVPERLRCGGYILFETGTGQAEAVAALLEKNGLAVDEIKNDLAGTPRCVIAQKMS